MESDAYLAQHYGRPDLLACVRSLLPNRPSDWRTWRELDQFHVMGHHATEALADAMQLEPGRAFLDVGAGFGGPARTLAAERGLRVTGLDLLPDYVEVARWLAEQVDLGDRVRFVVGSALDLPFADAQFDGAWTLHVGMNIRAKSTLYAEIARVLKPGAQFGLLDFTLGEGTPEFPLPWSREPVGSHLVTALELDEELERAGFRTLQGHDLSEEALNWLTAPREAPKPNLVSLIFREDAGAILRNLRHGLESGSLRLAQRVLVRAA